MTVRPNDKLQKIKDLIDMSQLEEAFQVIQKSFKGITPELAWNEIALIYINKNKINKAIECLRNSITLKPSTDAYINLACICVDLNKDEQALNFLYSALELNPKDELAHNLISKIFYRHNKFNEAIYHLKRSSEIKPNQEGIFFKIGQLYDQCQLYLDAIDYYKKDLEINPNNEFANANIGHDYHQIGDSEVAYKYYIQYVEKSKVNSSYSFLLYMMHHSNKFKNKDFYELANKFYLDCIIPKLQDEGKKLYKHNLEDLNPNKERIRIGMVSKYFFSWTGEKWILELIKERNKDKFELYIYHDNQVEDEASTDWKHQSDQWFNVSSLSDKEFADKIAGDKIDIMIDLLGHVRGNRLESFAYKPAPIQVSWFGYFGTTGLPQMDYVFADAQVVREGDEQFFTEKVYKLPHSYCFFKPDDYSVALTEPPVIKNGYITFGAFHRFSKVSIEVLELWSQVLKEVQDSKLYIKAPVFKDQKMKEKIKNYFVELGIEETRIRIESESNKEDYLNCYNKVDISLDSFPYGGGTTTMHSNWMGVPVISLEGDIWTYRGGGPLYNRLIGHPELVVQDKKSYINLAKELSLNINRLKVYRKEFRGKFLNSPVCDAHGYMKDLENALATAWQEKAKELLLIH